MNYWIFTVADQYLENFRGSEYWTAERVVRNRLGVQFWGIKQGAKHILRILRGDRVVFYVAAQQFIEEPSTYEGKYFAASCTLKSIFTTIYNPLDIAHLLLSEYDPNTKRKQGVYLKDIHWFRNKVWLDAVKDLLEIFQQSENVGYALHNSINPIGQKDFEKLEILGNPI